MKSDKERLTECMECDSFETCFNTVPYLKEYKDGTCKTKDALKGKYGELEFGEEGLFLTKLKIMGANASAILSFGLRKEYLHE